MNLDVKNCHKTETNIQDNRPWWEPPYVTYAFSNPGVKKRLEELMGSHTVRVTDREYMQRLMKRIREHHVEQVRKKIAAMEQTEVEREKRLMLEGKVQMDEVPAELVNHPVFKVNKLVDRILEEKMLKDKAKMRPKKVKTFDYDLLLGVEEEKVEDTDLIECIEEGPSAQEMRSRLDEVGELVEDEDFDMYTGDDYLRIKYKDPLVEELMEAEGVDEVYEIADEVVGALSGKPCGALVKRA